MRPDPIGKMILNPGLEGSQAEECVFMWMGRLQAVRQLNSLVRWILRGGYERRQGNLSLASFDA
jgi:hypothetical protein